MENWGIAANTFKNIKSGGLEVASLLLFESGGLDPIG